MTLINILFGYIVSLLIISYYRKKLTYKGLVFVLFVNNLVLLTYCSCYWNYYVVTQGVENFALRLNSNTWGSIQYNINFKINILSFLFVLLVTIIGTATTLFTFTYFKYEERGEDFILLLNWFILSMLILVIGNNFFTIIIGWELVGTTSFLLINFWKIKVSTLSSSIKAFVFNKVSDIFLMMSFCLLKTGYNIENIDTLLVFITFNKTTNLNLLFWSAICLLICSCIKSVQLVGHLWLPDSMEAPVPASALIHSATLVSAGVYLILKFYILFTISNLLPFIFYLGSITACYGGIVAASQSDLKKILAYSTISHCGFIFSSMAFNNFFVTIIYLYLHGLFKAATFFCAGFIIKDNNTQDSRLMGMNKSNPFNTMSMIISAINLGGLPFTCGSLYKETFLNYLIISNVNFIGYGFCILGMITSVVYVYKLIYYSCFDFRKGSFQYTFHNLQNSSQLKNRTRIFRIWDLELVRPIPLKIFHFSSIKALSFWILYSYSIIFYIITKFYISKIYIFLSHTGEIWADETQYLGKLFFLRKHLISLYYIFFKSTIFSLVLNNNRTNYFYVLNLTIFRQLFIFIAFYTLINFVFKYMYVWVF